MTLRSLLQRLGDRLAPRAVYALYHEARNRYHQVYCNEGAVLVCFSRYEWAKHFAKAAQLRGYLPARITPAVLVEEHDELASLGMFGFLLDPRLVANATRAIVYRLKPVRQRYYAAAIVDALLTSRRLLARIRREVLRQTRGQPRLLRRVQLAVVERHFAHFDEALEELSDYMSPAAMVEASLSARSRRMPVVDEAAASEAIDGAADGAAAPVPGEYASAIEYELGMLAFLRGKTAVARAHLQASLNALPNYAGDFPIRPHAALGAVLRRMGDTPLAIEAYRAALDADRERPDVGLVLLNLYQEQDREDDAEKLLDDLHARFPHDPSVLSELAAWYTRRERYQEALEVRRRIAAEHPGDTTNLVALALLCDFTNNLEEGFIHFARAIARTGDPALVSQFHQFCISQGLRALKSGESDEALRCLRTVARARPDCPNTLLALSFAMDASGVDRDEAAKLRKKAEDRGAIRANNVFDLTEEALIAELRGQNVRAGRDDRPWASGERDDDDSDDELTLFGGDSTPPFDS